MEEKNRAIGEVNLVYKLKDEQSRVAHLWQKEPLRVMFPKMKELGIESAAILNMSGGIVSSDTMNIDFTVESGASALLTTVAADKYYQAATKSLIINNVTAKEDSWLEWMPQESIIFDKAMMQRELNININETSRVMAGEILVFGRKAFSETFKTGFIHDSLSINCNNKKVFHDVLHLEEDISEIMKSSACFDNSLAYATFLYLAKDAEHLVNIAREELRSSNKNIKIGVTSFENILVVKYLAKETYLLRNKYVQFWQFWRHHVYNLSRVAPKLWFF